MIRGAIGRAVFGYVGFGDYPRITVLVLLACLCALPLSASDPRPAGRETLPDFDSRVPAVEDARKSWTMRSPTPGQTGAVATLRAMKPGLDLRWDGLSGGPGWIAAPKGDVLAPPRAGDPVDVARAFLVERAALFGLSREETAGMEQTAVVPARNGGHHVHFRQTVAGIEVFGSHLVVNLTPDGAVRSAGARLFAGLVSPGVASIGAADAVRVALDGVYPETFFTNTPLGPEVGPQRKVAFDVAGVGFPPRARLVLFPQAQGASLAWEVDVAEWTRFTSYRVLIDATDGALLFRRNMTDYAEARHIEGSRPQPDTAESLPTNYVVSEIPSVTSESPVGWIAGDGASLEGNNATTHLGYWWEPGLNDPLASYDYPFDTPASALVNMWWWANVLHDRFYALGFNEAAGNYQLDNFGNGGTGGDAMKMVHYAAGLRNDAFFSGDIDGGVSTLNFGWRDCRFCGDHDGLTDIDRTSGERADAYSVGLVTHEYTHGVTNRLVAGPATWDCARGTQAGALNEGTSDFFRASFAREHPRLDAYVEGTGRARSVWNDLTYDDFCDVHNSGCEIHADGMIWSATLWDLRESMRALDPAAGLDSLHQLVLEGWAVAPCNPTFLDLRAALLDADNDLFGGANATVIWNVFAARGMGDDASTTGNADTSPVAGFGVRAGFECTPPSDPTSLFATPSGDNAVQLTYDATGALGVEIWRESLDNPWDRPTRIAVTDDTTTFTDDTVQGGTSYRYHVVGMGAGGLACRSGASATADATATGPCDAFPLFEADVGVTDGDPSCQATLSWSPATPGCAGEPIVYNIYRAPTPGFEPSDRLLVGRTTATSFQDIPPQTTEFPFKLEMGNTSYYLVLAQHGTLADPPDHTVPVPSQLLRWVPAVPTLGRETEAFWDFDSGAAGWTTDNTNDPAGGWVLVAPQGTWFAGALLAPDEAAGGSGMSWVTGDGGNVTEHDCDGRSYLTSPVWDGTGGATILSFDYWSWIAGVPYSTGIDLSIDNGTDRVTLALTGLNTTQPFDTAARHSWQHAELNLADFVAPTSTMSIEFSGLANPAPLSEYGIDNVRIERATACSRSGLQLRQVTVDDTPAGWGNGNGVLEPGETARLQVQIENQGTSTAFSPLGLVSACSSGVVVHDPSAVYADVAPAALASSAEGFTVSLLDSVGCDASVCFDFEWVDAAGTVSQAILNLEPGTTVTDVIFADDFETDKGWNPEGAVGHGRWERGDPVGTMDGPNQANPEDDSPFDAGTQCYVTENISPGGDPNAADVDSGQTTRLRSPLFDLTGHRQARASFDLWLYDNTPSNPVQDYAEYRVVVVQNGEGDSHLSHFYVDDPTGGWARITRDLTRVVPMTHDIRINFFAVDGGADSIVEVGLDNFRLEGDRQQCDPSGVTQSPNDIGNSLRVDKVNGRAEFSWTSSVVDPTHDGAAYYQVFVSAAAPAGFAVGDTTTTLMSSRDLSGATEFYKITAVNSAGTSGDEPAP